MLVRRAALWLVAAVVLGLVTALLIAGAVAQAALQRAALTRLAQDAAALATALPTAPALPRGAVLLSAEGARLAGDALGDPSILEAALRRAAGPGGPRAQAFARAGWLVALQPLPSAAGDGAGAAAGAVLLLRPAAQVEARLGTILLGALRDTGLVLLLCLPAAWIGARLLLGPLAAAAAAGATLLDALLAADLAAEQAQQPFLPDPVLAAAAPGADPQLAEAARVAGALLARLDATAAAILAAEAAPA